MMMMDSTKKEDAKDEPVVEFDEEGNKIITLPLVGWKMREQRYLLLLETFGVLMAIFSTVTAIVAFNKMKAASNDVSNIVNNWSTVPVKSIQWVNSGTACPSGYTAVAPMATQTSDAYCACASGAQYYLSTSPSTNPKSATSGSGICYTNQTSPTQSGAYKCVTIPAGTIPSVSLSSWMGQTQCIQTGFSNAIDTKAPDSEGACPSGTHQCGSAALPLCIADSFGATACPVNWQADTSAISAYGVSANQLTQANLGVPQPTSFAYPGTSSVVNPSRTVNHYIQAGKVFVSGVWTPLPIVEIGNSVGVPCYGEEGIPSAGTQSKLGSTTIDGSINIASPETCSQGTDARYMATKNYKLGELIFENAATSCDSSTASLDYFSSSAHQCSSTASDGTRCVISGNAVLNTCVSTDKICQYAKYQSKCGQWQNIATTNTQTASFYQKAQIYWAADCPYTKTEVVDSNSPLQKAINIQKVLLILNTIVNVVLILLGSYIAYLCCAKTNANAKKYEELEGIWKPRATTFGTLIKIPVIIATIVVTKAITNFFVTLGDKNCAGTDAMGMITNGSFKTLADVLPGVVSANAATLAMDIIGFLPAVWAYIKPYFTFEEGGGLPDNGAPSTFDKKSFDLNKL